MVVLRRKAAKVLTKPKAAQASAPSQLSQQRTKKAPRVLSRTTVAPKVLRKPFGKPVGKKQKDGSHALAYSARPSHPSFKAIRAPKALLDGTTVYADFKNNKILYYSTKRPDGMVIGWDLCADCHLHVNNCRCDTTTMRKCITDWKPKGELERLHGVKVAIVTDDEAPAIKKLTKASKRQTTILTKKTSPKKVIRK